MLPSSVRRVVAAAPQSPAVSSLTSVVPRAAAAYSLPYRPTGLHQRRYSSSKPSSPDDGSRDFAARSVPASRGSKSEKTKGQAKAPIPQPPSVPSTRHIGDEGLALSTFFALHRPISVTQLMPKSVSDDTFAQIFATRTRSNKVADVLSTLSQTVSDLEEPLSRMSIANGDQQRSHDAQDAEEGTAKLSLRHSDGSETNLHIQLNPLAGQYLPYAPPPPPEPLTEAAEADAESAADSAVADELAEQQQPETQTRVYKAVVTIEETVDADGQVKVVAHSPELIEEDAIVGRPRSFLERMAWRQLRYDEARRQQDRAMQAISVKRQRKLKMKKKKYKKLMRKTRNIRRKLDRL
ncbi:hypothetical protein MYCTH_2295272 [Thermothelomyces thermophilus ATCC 42464]|uniref:Small ribosomal subunit protein mS38 n=1 Tax=Thermothelomyces thermophilus (strain ATCC 42464 / BCRC 31852 / DSM 1799) TaxID=573729 RepID=G2Q4F3_THET4|nr:uncharacterized protein MYCTH_2295272 [Thermothelomyces thermophilus ATCC 42464]AEO53646.1 hypothetical protein MYCTH_2295272 [Thermothelomyces thermophilus ATCC 42464]